EALAKKISHKNVRHFGTFNFSYLLSVVKLMRVHQWVKNLLIFVPVIMAHRIGNVSVWLSLLAAFVSFGLCASSVYLFNDIADLESDRQHPTKQNRPIANGRVSIVAAL